MKLLAILTLAIVASTSSADWVSDCQTDVRLLLDYLATPGEVEAEMVLLENTICPGDANPSGCKEGIRAWWPQIVEAINSVSNCNL